MRFPCFWFQQELLSILGCRDQQKLTIVLDASRAALLSYDEQMCDVEDPEG